MVESRGMDLERETKGLGVFVGEFTHLLDPKKRLTIPSVWRTQVNGPNSLYVLPDANQRCLNLYPAAEMVAKLDRLRSHSMSDSKARHFARVLGRASEVVTWDSQGRIRIKDGLLAFGGIENEVLMVGAIDRVELWNPAAAGEAWKVEGAQVAAGIDQDVLREAGDYVGM